MVTCLQRSVRCSCSVGRSCGEGLKGCAAVLCRYAAPLYIDIKKTVITRVPNGEAETEEESYPKIFIGEVSACQTT